MKIEDLEGAIRILEGLRNEQRDDYDPTETDAALRQALTVLEGLRSSVESATAEFDSVQNQAGDRDNAMSDDELGLDEQGGVQNRAQLVEQIKALAERVKKAQISHRHKKADVGLFLHRLWGKSYKTSKGTESYVNELETTRRLLITLKKHLGRQNKNSTEGKYKLSVGKEKLLKEDYYQVLEGMITEHRPSRLIEPRHLKGFRKTYLSNTTRFYYNTVLLERPELSVADWARVNRMNRSTPETVDYVISTHMDPSGPAAIEGQAPPMIQKTLLHIIYYSDDDSERRNENLATSRARRLLIDNRRVDAEYVTARYRGTTTAVAKQPKDADEIKVKHKRDKCDELLKKVAELAGVNPGDNASELDYVQVISELHRQIWKARILITATIESYRARHNQSRFRRVLPSLEKSVEYVAERLADWEGHLKRVDGFQTELGAIANEADDARFKSQVLHFVQLMLRRRIAGSHFDAMLASLPAAQAHTLKNELGDPADLEDELSDAGGASALAVYLLWVLKTVDTPEPFTSPSVFVADFDVIDEDLTDIRKYYVDNLARADVERLRAFALAAISLEVAELSQLIRWARGDLTERKKTDWVALGDEIEKYIQQAKGIILFADKFEGGYQTLHAFLTWVLYGLNAEKPESKDDSTPWHKCLYVGEGSVAFQIYVKVEASLEKMIKAGAKLGIQVSGAISSDDDRRVRWKDFKLSVVYKLEASATTPSLPDILDNELAVGAVNAKMSAAMEGSFGGVTHVRVYESHLHAAASIAQSLAHAQLILKYPFNRIAHPTDGTKQYKIFSGIPEDETQEKILEDFVGEQETLGKVLKLLQQDRATAWVFDEPNCKVSGDMSMTVGASTKAHAETKQHTTNYGRFQKTKYDKQRRAEVLQLWSQKEGGEKGMVETHGWSQSWPATAFSGIDISAVWMRETDPGPDNPLALKPLGLLPASPDTETLLSGGFTADRGTIQAGVTHIAHNPNPDNDGAYLNIKGVRSWGANVGSDLATPVSLGLSFSKSKAKTFDPERLRTQFNRMFELAHVYFERQKATGAEYDDGERPNGSQVDTWLEFFESPEGIVLASILNKQSVYGIFELNFVYDNGAFELQYGRIWRTYDMSVSVEASAPGLPFLKIGGELSGTMKHCPYETLGLGTLTYIQTVRNGFRNRSVIDLNWWDEWMAYHEDELYALFNHLRWDRHAVGAEVSQALGTVAKPGDDGEAAALRKAAEELLKVVDWATLDAHYKSDDVEERLGRTEKSRRVHLGHLSRRIGRKLKKKTKLTRTINSYGTGMIWLHDDLAWVRGQTFNLENYELTKKAPQRAGEHPMFFLRSGNPYKIVFGLSQPHLIKSAKLELLDNSESVVCEWTLDHKACEFIAYRGEDLKSTAKADIKKIESKFRYDGGKFRSKFGRDYQHTPEMAQAWETDEFGIFVDWIRWDGGKKSTLDSAGKQLKDGQGLSAAGSPYCLRLVAEPLDIVPDLGISPPLAWTYFHVLDDATEKPLEKLVSYLDKKGAYQKFDQDCRWEGTEIAIGDLDVEMRMYQDELDGDQVAIATSDVHQTQSPVVGVNIMPEATDLEEEEELDENDGQDLAPPDDAQPWNQYLGSLLDGPHKKLVNRNVHMVGVLQQDDAWSCSLHSAKNAMWLAQMQSVAQGATRQVAEFQVEFRIEQMADADQFKSRFLGDGSVGAPAPKSWLAVAKQVTPQIVMNGLAGDELAELLQALKDPSRVNPRLLPGVADSIIPVGQMGPGPRYAVKENIKLFVDAVRSFVGDTKAMAFAVGVGNQHFIACLLHQPVDVVEVLVADSLNRPLAQNSLAVEGLLSWVDDLDARIYDSFQVNHGEPLARIQGSDWTVEETAAAIKFLEDCGVMEREEERDRYIDWRNTADLVLAAKDQDPKAEDLRKRLKLDRT